jgi:hypothetical protein
MRGWRRPLLFMVVALGAAACSSPDEGDAKSGGDSAITADAQDDGGADVSDDAAAVDGTDGSDGGADGGVIDAADALDPDADDALDPDADDAVDPDADGLGASDGVDGEIVEDVPPVKVCEAGQTTCIGAKLGTCGPFQDGWIESNCFPGLTCSGGACVPVSNNLIIAFDTSGSMTGKVSGCSASGQVWPSCDPTKGCTRMDISKQVFQQALGKIDDKVTRMALFRFPQKLYYKTSTPSCTSGYYQGQTKLSTDPGSAQSIDAASPWFWTELNETACVEFPKDGAFKSKDAILKWMDGSEAMSAQGSCSNSSSVCKPVAGCDGTCCSGQCWVHTDRPHALLHRRVPAQPRRHRRQEVQHDGGLRQRQLRVQGRHLQGPGAELPRDDRRALHRRRRVQLGQQLLRALGAGQAHGLRPRLQQGRGLRRRHAR